MIACCNVGAPTGPLGTSGNETELRVGTTTVDVPTDQSDDCNQCPCNEDAQLCTSGEDVKLVINTMDQVELILTGETDLNLQKEVKDNDNTYLNFVYTHTW